ncbi:MAG: hypothetical protein K5682_10340, partial [Lachnospiraceae bacterium]|nr:hypothetical protein [Lachnospiraceae bacterium]
GPGLSDELFLLSIKITTTFRRTFKNCVNWQNNLHPCNYTHFGAFLSTIYLAFGTIFLLFHKFPVTMFSGAGSGRKTDPMILPHESDKKTAAESSAAGK